MTIPIIPGPFSFIGELGRGVGTAFKVAEDQKRTIRTQQQEDRAEASKNLMSMIELYSKGVLKKLDTDAVLELGARAGMGDFLSGNVVPKPENIIAEGQNDFLSNLLSNRTPGNEPEVRSTLATGKVQTAPDLAKDKLTTQVAGAQSAAIEAGGAAGRAIAGVPQEEVARTTEEKAKDTQYDSQASRMADASITQLGGNILKLDPTAVAQTAWEKAQADAKTRGEILDESLTRPYIEAAVASRYREALTEEARVRAASARGGQSDLDNYLKLLQNQQQMIRNQINALPAPTPQQQTFATIYEGQLKAKRTPEEQAQWEGSPATQTLRTAYDAVQNYQKTVNSLNNEANGYRDQLGNALQLLTGQGAATPGREQRKLPDATVDAIVKRMREQNIQPSQVDADVQAGKITAADGAAIKSRLTAGAGGRF